MISESPRGKGFGKAALSLSKAFRRHLRAGRGQGRQGHQDRRAVFASATRPARRAQADQKPRWIRTLSPEGMASIYPEAAVKAGVGPARRPSPAPSRRRAS
ncbi:hypothetical protein ACRAWD_12175 [Caulobacter segnis]